VVDGLVEQSVKEVNDAASELVEASIALDRRYILGCNIVSTRSDLEEYR
jgi:hypothetical protein